MDTITSKRESGWVVIREKVGDLVDLWNRGCYRPSELVSPCGAVLRMSYVTSDLVAVEFENGCITLPYGATIPIFD